MLSAPISAATDWPSQRPAATTTRRAVSSPSSRACATSSSARVPVGGRREAPSERRVGGVVRRLGRGADDRARAGDGLEAAEPAAAALRAVVDDHGVPDLPGAEAVAVEDLALDDDPGTDAQADLHRHEAGGAPAPLEQVLGERRGARVVGDARRQPGALGQDPGEREVLPVEVDRPADRAGGGVHEARRADADAEDRAGLGGQHDELVDQGGQRRERLVAVEAVGGHLAGRADLAAEVDEGAGEHALAEVDRDDQPGVVDDLEQDRGLAAARRPEAHLADEALGEDVGDELADGGAGEPGEAGDLGAADRPVVVQRAQDEAAVEPARLLVRRLARERHSRSSSSGSPGRSGRP